jgi:hypothetical protein
MTTPPPHPAKRGSTRQHHFTKTTVEASLWCTRSGGETMHMVQQGRRGACILCLNRSTTPPPPTVICPACGRRHERNQDFGALCDATCLNKATGPHEPDTPFQ